MHIAAAVKTPTVSIFSAVDIPFLWYPAGNNHKVFYNKVECSPCFQKECENHICMEGIPVERVYNAVKEQLYKMGIKKRGDLNYSGQ
jgi:ADP-heptose:LPS heptosyltransferase